MAPAGGAATPAATPKAIAIATTPGPATTPAPGLVDARAAQPGAPRLAIGAAVVELKLWLHRFVNVDLFEQGWYAFRISASADAANHATSGSGTGGAAGNDASGTPRGGLLRRTRRANGVEARERGGGAGPQRARVLVARGVGEEHRQQAPQSSCGVVESTPLAGDSAAAGGGGHARVRLTANDGSGTVTSSPFRINYEREDVELDHEVCLELALRADDVCDGSASALLRVELLCLPSARERLDPVDGSPRPPPPLPPLSALKVVSTAELRLRGLSHGLLEATMVLFERLHVAAIETTLLAGVIRFEQVETLGVTWGARQSDDDRHGGGSLRALSPRACFSPRGHGARGAAVEWGSEPPGETAAKNEVEVGVRSKGRSVGLDRSCLDSLYHRGLSLSRFARLLRPLLSTDDVPLYPRGLGGDGSAANSQLMEFTDAGLRAVAALDDLVDTAELARAAAAAAADDLRYGGSGDLVCLETMCARAREQLDAARGEVCAMQRVRPRAMWRVLRARAHLRERGAPSARLSSVRSTDFWGGGAPQQRSLTNIVAQRKSVREAAHAHPMVAPIEDCTARGHVPFLLLQPIGETAVDERLEWLLDGRTAHLRDGTDGARAGEQAGVIECAVADVETPTARASVKDESRAASNANGGGAPPAPLVPSAAPAAAASASEGEMDVESPIDVRFDGELLVGDSDTPGEGTGDSAGVRREEKESEGVPTPEWDKCQEGSASDRSSTGAAGAAPCVGDGDGGCDRASHAADVAAVPSPKDGRSELEETDESIVASHIDGAPGPSKAKDRSSAASPALFRLASDEPGVCHLVVLVHGFLGNSLDLRLWRNHIALVYPGTEFLMSCANENKGTFDDIDLLAERLATEVDDKIAQLADCNRGVVRLSFIGCSIGNLVVRACLGKPLMRPMLARLHTYVSISGPHLGCLYIGNSLVDGGMRVLGAGARMSGF